MTQGKLTRREFVNLMGASLAGASMAGCTIVPRHAVARSGKIPPSERLNVASVGVGGQGGSDLNAVAQDQGVNIVALCEIDEVRGAANLKKYSQARRFKDFRRMFDAMDKQIDAVIVGTPDHTHAAIAMAALERGKHVYCEKPLAHSIHEVRALMQAAKKYDVVTQLGNQGHSFESCRIFCEWIQDGAIGNVHTIHCGCGSANSALAQLDAVATERPPVPDTLDWDLWQGPAAVRPYHPAFVPGKWRAWVPYGNGTIGDWICHVVDPVFWALDLGAPATIHHKAIEGYNYKKQGLTYPPGSITTFEFAAKGKRGPVTLHWYSGACKIPRPKELEPTRRDIETGAVVIGDKGVITYGSHGAGQVRIIPETKMREYKRPAPSIPRAKEHHQDWLEAIRTGRKAGSDFSYGGPLTELAHLSIISMKAGDVKLEWDAERMRFPNHRAAEEFLSSPARRGWRV